MILKALIYLCLLCEFGVKFVLSHKQFALSDTLTEVLGRTNITLSVNVVLVSMIKDEGDILRMWLEYHSILFGAQNIIILDNFSTCNITLGILKEYQTKGLHVIYEQGPYIKMGNLAYTSLKSLFPTYQLALPLDVDEFLVAYIKGIPYPNRRLILAQMNFLWAAGGPCFFFRQYYGSYPTEKNTTIDTIHTFTRSLYGGRIGKKIFWLQEIKTISFGAHSAVPINGTHENIKCKNGMDRLGLLHYHIRSPLVTAQRAMRDCIALDYLPANATMETLSTLVPVLQKLVVEHRQNDHKNNIAFHKIEELLKYAEYGEDAFVFQKIDNLEEVGTLREIIDHVGST